MFMYVRLKWLPWNVFPFSMFVYFLYVLENLISEKQVSPEEGYKLFIFLFNKPKRRQIDLFTNFQANI